MHVNLARVGLRDAGLAQAQPIYAENSRPPNVSLIDQPAQPLSSISRRGPESCSCQRQRGDLQMRVNAIAAERTDQLWSRVAAISFVRDLYESLMNWPLALTAYSAGLGGVRVVGVLHSERPNIVSMAERGLLPEQTLRYVPLVLGSSDGMRSCTRTADQKRRFAGR